MTNSWLCALCTDEEGSARSFDSQEKLHEHNKKFHSNGRVEPKIEPKPEPTHPKPQGEIDKPTLTYTWIGQCPNCRTQLETIPLDIDQRTKNIIVIAWCPSCKEKRAQRSVAKL